MILDGERSEIDDLRRVRLPNLTKQQREAPCKNLRAI
jgi:hypothetical protein